MEITVKTDNRKIERLKMDKVHIDPYFAVEFEVHHSNYTKLI